MYIKRIKEKFKKTPTFYYSMSIAATWAGVGSLMNGITMLRKYGIIPFLIWTIGNVLACAVFGLLAPTVPRLRDVFRSKTMHLVVGIMCVFQIWLNMTGIQEIFAETQLGGSFGMIIAYAAAAFFLVLLLRFGMIRNVLTDNMSWWGVYIVAVALSICGVLTSHGNMVVLDMGLTAERIYVGCNKGLLLLPGAFLYPYFFDILDYNDSNADGTTQINTRRAFCIGGVLFGVYLIFPFLFAWTNFGPALNILKAVLVTLVAISTLSSFLYSVYITFGRKAGLAINVISVGAWQFLMPLGVMGVWTLMAQIRIYIVAGAFAAAFVWHITDRKAARI